MVRPDRHAELAIETDGVQVAAIQDAGGAGERALQTTVNLAAQNWTGMKLLFLRA